jgi:hypothetical protein
MMVLRTKHSIKVEDRAVSKKRKPCTYGFLFAINLLNITFL